MGAKSDSGMGLARRPPTMGEPVRGSDTCRWPSFFGVDERLGRLMLPEALETKSPADENVIEIDRRVLLDEVLSGESFC